MGGLVRTLFGGSSNKSGSTQGSESDSVSRSEQTSGNRALQMLTGALGNNIGQGNNAMAQIGNILGIGGGSGGGSGTGFQNYLDSAGYNHIIDSGSKAITGNKASQGLLRSGGTLEAQTQFGQDTGSKFLNDYLAQLTGLGNYGLQSAQTIAGAGNFSEGSSDSRSKSRSFGESYGKGSSTPGIINSLFG